MNKERDLTEGTKGGRVGGQLSVQKKTEEEEKKPEDTKVTAEQMRR